MEMTREMLLEWQEQTLATAKEALSEDGHLTPYVFVMTLPDRVKESIKKHTRAMAADLSDLEIDGPDGLPGKPVPWSDLSDTTPTLAILPQQKTEEEWFAIAVDLLVEPEKRSVVETLVAVGKSGGFSASDTRKRILKILMETAGLGEKDLLALHIRDVLKRMGALAYCKVDDGYTMNVSPKEGETVEQARRREPGDLANAEQATEAIIVQLETPTFMRTITLPYTRTKRNTGKVKEFGEPRVIESLRAADPNHRLTGRFTWMLEAPV